jgi:hypothetical protein
MILHHPKTKPLPFRVAHGHEPAWKMPFLGIEHLFEWTVYVLSNWAFLEALEYVGSFSILIAVIFYFAESDARVKQRHYQAWQVINTAQGKGGSVGRIDALQQLNEDNVSLTGVDVAGAYLYGLKLEKANLVRANFHNSDARKSVLDEADLEDADLTGANFREGSLRKAKLDGADLTDASLDNADLTQADLSDSNLQNADLHGAELRGVHWQGVRNIKMANIYGVKDAPAEFVAWALQHGAAQTAPEAVSAKLDQK